MGTRATPVQDDPHEWVSFSTIHFAIYYFVEAFSQRSPVRPFVRSYSNLRALVHIC